MVTWIPSIYPLYVSINIAYMDPMGYVIYFMLISVYEKLSLWGITIHPIFSFTPKCRAANQ